MDSSEQILNKEGKKTNRYLCFNLGPEQFAIPLLAVKEVIGLPKVTPVPQSSPQFLGVIDLRGTVISIIDFRKKFNIKSELNPETTVVILDIGELNIGILVDCVNSVVTMPLDQIKPCPGIESSKSIDHITGVFHKDDQLILMLNVAKALSVDDKAELKWVGQKQSA